MKTVHKSHSGGESCSCTTCVYKSESASLRRIIDLGSRIDRLYYGKYISLRERKLLQRLVRTRAVYDDIRAKLVSESTLSGSTIRDYNPREKSSFKELDDTEKSSGAVLELVNIVDRGAVGSKELSNCCSCCSCSSNIKIHQHKYRQRRAYEGAVRYLAKQKRLREAHQRQKGVRFKTKHVRSDPCACTFELIKKHSKALYKRMQQGPHVPVDIRSTIDEEIRQNLKRVASIARASYQNLIESNAHTKEKILDGISKLRESQTQIQEKIEFHTKASIEKFNQAKGKLVSKLREISVKNENENQLAFHVKKDSISKFKDQLRRKQIMKDWECEPECDKDVCVPKVCFIKLKKRNLNRKNVHHKGINYSIKTQERKTAGSLRHSSNKIQAQNLPKGKTIETKKPVLQAQQTRGVEVLNVSSENIPKKTRKVGSRVIKVLNEKENENGVLKIVPPEKVNVKNEKASHSTEKVKLENTSLERKSSQGQAVRIGSSFSFNIEFYKDKPKQEIQAIDSDLNKKHMKNKKTKKKRLRQKGSQIKLKKSLLKGTQTGGHALKRCFCTLTLKAKAHKSKIRQSLTKQVMTTKKSKLILNSPTALTFSNIQTNTVSKQSVPSKPNLRVYECDPGVCLPGKCDPYQCIKLINIREAKLRNSSTQARKPKSDSSTSALRPYKLSKSMKVQSIANQGKMAVRKRIRQENRISDSQRHKQAVRIGSTFSFNVEFYKGSPSYLHTTKPQTPLKSNSLSIKPKQKEHRKSKVNNLRYQGDSGILRKNTPTQIIKKERNARIGTTLKRCFCTLALQNKNVLKSYRTRKFTTATETSELKPIDTAHKATKTKLKYSRSLNNNECETYKCIPGECDPYICLERINLIKNVQKEIKLLKPYECEPFACHPGECDPYVCLKRINKRIKDIGLTTARSKTMSNSTSHADKSLKAVYIQHGPRHKERKVLAKTLKPKKYADINKNISDISKNISHPPSRQAVKIGSTFSFDIEFYKTKSPNIKGNQKYHIKKPKSSNKSMNKKVEMSTLNVAQIKTQVHKLKKRDKGYVVGPLLKRCFCTLNLQKKWKHHYFNNDTSLNTRLLFQPPKVYTINTAMIGYTQGYSQQCVKRLENFANGTNTIVGTTCSSLSSETHSTRLTSLTRYFHRCFHTMNVKVENRSNNLGKDSIRRKKHKLLPYECEPGVCTPGECNPYMCQEMIARRLNRSSSKKSGSDYSSYSNSSAINQSYSKNKENKPQTVLMNKSRNPQVQEETPLVYEKANAKNQKQVVRIGSSFSFDIQFSKKPSLPKKSKYSSGTNLVAKYVKHSSKSNGTDKEKSNTQSQSFLINTIHRGSFVKPTRERCFCTLKLQKKGRLHRKLENQQYLTPRRQLNKKNTVSRGQNTKKVKPVKLTYSLEPYECESNVCIPGQCDPYQCLDRIKKRNFTKDVIGTNTIFHEIRSVSGTNTDNYRKINYKSRGAGLKSNNLTSTVQDRKIYSDYNNAKPSRQAVRVGSSFSFNIEFFKEHPSLQHHRDTYVSKNSIKNNHSRNPSSILKKHTDNYTQNNNISRNKYSQLENNTQHASTLTNTFMQRCFCTAQLYEKTNEALKTTKQEYFPSFIKRCFCLIKKFKPTNKTSTRVVPKITQSKKTNTRKFQGKPKLEPYECKPGICVPGECDPYVCDKIMRKYRNESSKTDPVKTKSVSSYKIDMNKNNVKTLKGQNNLNSKNNKAQGHEMLTPYNNRESKNPDRNVVQIGSKFSFDVEFYKEHPITTKTKVKHQESKTYKSKFKGKVDDIDNKKKVRISSIKTISPSNISQSSQVKKIKVKDRGVGIHNLIKRCFCTLKLDDNNKNNIKSKPKDIGDQNMKKVKAKKVKTLVTTDQIGHEKQGHMGTSVLLPHECEPNTCIPYHCDPYECQKRIKLRRKNKLNREFDIATSSPNKISSHSLTQTKNPKTKSHFTYAKKLHTIVKRTPHTPTGVNDTGKSRQSVRIGSAFSFNIEFSKDKHRDGFEIQKLPKIDKLKSNIKDYKNNNANWAQIDKNVINKNKSNQHHIMNTRSTMTEFVSNKKCFCTLSLQQSEVPPPLPVKTLHAGTETDVKKTMIHSVSNLLPYECEPNVCVPGKCDPVKCLKKIKERNRKMTTMTEVSNLLPYECEPNVCVPGKCNPVQCFKKIKKRSRNFRSTMTESQKKVFLMTVEQSERNSVATMMKRGKDTKINEAQVKLLQPLNSKQIHRQNIGPNKNRQLVRIGSNFSFDIEFYKTNNLNFVDVSNFSKILETNYHSKTIPFDNDLKKNIFQDRALQSSFLKKASRGSSIVPFLKRCFCSLKLQKSDLNKNSLTKNIYSKKPKERQVSKKNKGITTKKIPKENTFKHGKLSPFECEPFYCIPGECDPYQCAKRIKMREKKNKTQYTNTKSSTRTQKLGIKLDNNKSRRNQTQLTHKALKSSDINQREIIKGPKFTNDFKKQAVRIGSDLSFNIKFYKESIPLTNKNLRQIEHVDDKKQNKYKKNKRRVQNYHREQNTVTQLQNRGSQYNRTNMVTKAVEAENTLKRCFCTLKLQNQPVVAFPQNIEVRRVAVRQNTKTIKKESNLCKEIKTILPYMPEKFNKTCSRIEFSTENKYNKLGKPIIIKRAKRLSVKKSEIQDNKHIIPTKNKHKYSFGIRNFITWCSKLFHRNSYPQKFSCDGKIKSKTPTVQRKFSACERQSRLNPSATNLKFKKNNQTCPKYLVYRSGTNQGWPPRVSVVSNQKSQLNKSIYKKANKKQQITSKKNHKDMGCACSTKISHKKQNTSKSLNTDLNLNYITSKMNNINNLKECHIWDCEYYKEKKNSRDKDYVVPGISLITKPKPLPKESIQKLGTKHENYTGEFFFTKDNDCLTPKLRTSKKPKSLKLELNSKKNLKRNNSINNLNECQTMVFKNKSKKQIRESRSSKKDRPIPRVRFLDKTISKSNIKKRPNFAFSAKSEKIAESPDLSSCRDKKIIKEEFDRAAGDQQDQKTKYANAYRKELPRCSVEKIMSKIRDKVRCAMNAEEPMLEMQIDSRNYDILNRNEVIRNVAKLKTKCKPVIEMHVDPKMCKVLNKEELSYKIINSTRKGNIVNKIVDSMTDIVKCPNKVHGSGSTNSNIRIPTGRPCVCGSPVCAKKILSMTKPKRARLRWKTCVCGSPICQSESAKIKAKMAKCLCKKEMEERKATRLKKEKKEHKIRMKLYKGEDKARRRERKKEHKALVKRIDKKTPDGILFAESVLDVGKFGVTASADVLRKVCRYAKNPKDVVYTLRALKDNPKFRSKFLKCHDTGLSKRIRLRYMAMSGMQKLRNKLQSYALTNYLLNINNPKRRLVKKKVPRQRERFDFNCSIYMSTLRKKRYLAIYDCCPWFYQHFLALVRAGKQLIDICLYLLAIVVWSPCILCMEICRACMCCFFCNG